MIFRSHVHDEIGVFIFVAAESGRTALGRVGQAISGTGDVISIRIVL